MATTRVSSKGQVIIPKQVREQQHWKAGQKLAFVPQGKHYILVPVPTSNELFGIAEQARLDE